MKMKKIVMGLVMALFAINAMAGRILWVGIGDNPQVEVNGVMTPLATWIASLPCDPADVGGRIRIGNTALPSGWEDPTQPIPPGQQHHPVVFDDDITEFEVNLVDTDGNPTGGYADWQPIRLTDVKDSDPLNVEIFFDLGYWDENSNWDFVSVATASAYVDSAFWNAHSYESGTLAPPTETPWRPFAVAVPEPSTAILALLGTCLLLKRRKNTHA